MLRVMLVDDHKIIREGIKALLADLTQIEFVTEADNGVDAIAKYEIYEPDLVILDVEMPGMDGVETCQKLKKQYPTSKVLAFSMHDDKNVVENMMKSGALGYVLKNSGKEELVTAIEQVAQNKIYFSSQISENIALDWTQHLNK